MALQKESHASPQATATAHLDGSAFEVQVIEHNFQSAVVNSLRNMLEAGLLKDDHRLCADDKHPDSSISCNITRYVPPRAQTVLATGN